MSAFAFRNDVANKYKLLYLIQTKLTPSSQKTGFTLADSSSITRRTNLEEEDESTKVLESGGREDESRKGIWKKKKDESRKVLDESGGR